MNWKLVLTLSIVGVVMAVLSVMGLIQNTEPLIWLMIWIIYALLIARLAPGNYFLHGLVTSVINGVWIAIIHATFIDQYLANNPGMLAQYESMPHFAGIRVMQLVVGPIIGAVTGLIVGLFAWLAGKYLAKKAVT